MIGYVTGVYDILRESNLSRLDETIQKGKERGNKIFAIGIYTENLCQELGIDEPLKTFEERRSIMEQIIGVDFTFLVDSNNENNIIKEIEKEYTVFLEKAKKESKKAQSNKKYKLAYVPGTYDLFHYRTFRKYFRSKQISR